MNPERIIKRIFQILGTAGLSVTAVFVFMLATYEGGSFPQTLIGIFFSILLSMAYLIIWETEIHNFLFYLIHSRGE
jgi:hypothetical protein